MSRLRLFGYYLPSLLSVVGRFYRLVARSDKRIVRFARVVARCGVVVNEDSSVNFNRGTAGFPVGILNVDDRIPTVDGIALRFEYTAINLQVSFLRGACRCYQIHELAIPEASVPTVKYPSLIVVVPSAIRIAALVPLLPLLPSTVMVPSITRSGQPL